MKFPSIVYPAILLAASGCTSVPFDRHRTSGGLSFVLTEERAERFVVSKVGHAMIDVQINGVPGRFVIDTGASHTVVTQTYAKRLGITDRPKGNVRSSSPSGKIELSTGVVSEIAIGSLKISKYVVVILSDQALRSLEKDQSIAYCDGLLGADILERFHSTINFAEQTIIFHKPDQKNFRQTGKFIARLEAIPRFRIVMMNVKIDEVEGWFQIDTGAAKYGGISEDSKLISVLREGSIAPYRKWAGFEIKTVSTLLTGQVLRVNDLINNNIEFDINDKDVGEVREGERYIDGTLGSFFLLKNGLIIDYARMEIRQGIRPKSPASGLKGAAASRSFVEQSR